MRAPSPPPPRPASPTGTPWRDPLRPQNPLVGHRWILAGVGMVVLAALLFGYATLLLLFWQGQWQLLFHPSGIVAVTPASAGLPFEDVHFDATETGVPQLDGWWVPAAPEAPFARLTVLYLHGATGSLSTALPEISGLHAAGVNVFAFDPRGYGRSLWLRPSEQSWNEDADAALRYLTATRHIDAHTVLLCGTGLGANLAGDAAGRQPLTPALILIDPEPPALTLLSRDPRLRLLPVRLLSHDRFDPSAALAASSADKLFIATAGAPGNLPFSDAAASRKAVLRSNAPLGSSPLDTPAVQAGLRQLFVAALRRREQVR